MTVGRIAGRIRRAQATIRRCIVKLPAETAIPYRKGPRDYSPEEHLVTVRGHIIAHLHRVERARRRRRRDERSIGSLNRGQSIRRTVAT
jgi:hypothetical protein